MSNSSSSSSRSSWRKSHGVPSRCWCGENIMTYTSKTGDNPYRRFYHCEIALQRKTEEHLFKWVDDALLDEIKMVDSKHNRLAEDVKDLRKTMMENMELEKKMLQNMEEGMKHHINENIEKELVLAKENMEKLGREMAMSTMKILGLAGIVLGTLAWFCRKLFI